MIILLAGGTEVSRSAIAAKILKKHKKWRHLPVAEIGGVTQLFGVEMETDDDLLFGIACECVTGLTEEGFHVVLTHDDAPALVKMLRRECGKDAVTAILLGGDDEKVVYDDVIDTRKSTSNDVFAMIEKIIVKHRAA
ncbi:MAG: hypothetical protein Q7R81_07825 [Candidatus Peregrinibacteria bacterium]|nr:hypothetical protein [Candidatus Peregrinibacteria bacterium]